ncbi:uncharacterized protein BDR25DRAFT_304260 [Lindgomyces ingoldianus]|uniref:Uncharacterized protein n=1 Tax=Lindgomyces ingoldianus TaxID=673940 RepID=A0ACB6QU89_9PLEO|nr:uncharacterized protein BDR25DRAFT_304260 [Lindgomyces ingoldianus]KAF2469857.1 hypothetical protein BDR25DRAFT_304260 [Lindgomyces ingoldianus]
MDDEEKHNLRSVRTSFLNHILKRPHSKPQSIRYEDTQPAEPLEPFSVLPNKRFMFRKSRTDESMESGDHHIHKTPLLIRFYDPEVNAQDTAGRTLDDILSWSNARLEHSHNYIQMLFPLPEGSPFNYDAPVITREVMEAFHARPKLQSRLREAFVRMLDFYGFDVLTREVGPVPEPEAKQKEQDEYMEQQGGAAQNGIVEHEQSADMENHVAQEDQNKTDASKTHEEIEYVVQQEHTSPTSQENPTRAPQNEATSNQTPNKPTSTTGDLGQPQPGADADANADPTDTSNPASAANHEHEQPAVDTTPLAEFPSPPEQKPAEERPVFIIVRAANYRDRFRNWAIRFDHNHLRITRILRSLRVLGLNEECWAFYCILKHVFDDPSIFINERSMVYWRRAVKQSLYLTPDKEEVLWLKRWCGEVRKIREEEKVRVKEEELAEEAARGQGDGQDEPQDEPHCQVQGQPVVHGVGQGEPTVGWGENEVPK